ncbi:hypothetical protein CSOJ01_12149 [Colletotrichum sojae]|uniref:Uncharacterized protein n=1 Tax=Colletotrichum sojae TaxID=2175907 RepID=A0A8H6IVK2_9PEZI|nr:hypothetical protein CSOJ01_12149 [Colletotrichum sojae]
MELLIRIAEYVDQDYVTFAPTDKILNYTTTQGQRARFRVSGLGDDDAYYNVWNPSGHAKWRAKHTRKIGDVLNLALANRRMLEACEPALYGRLVLRGDERGRLASLRWILSETKSYLQKYILHMVNEERGSSPDYKLWDEVGISFGPVFRNFKVLASLDIYTERGGNEHWREDKKRTARWCRILPELTSLRRLSMTGFGGFSEFPLMPQLQEACFHHCDAAEDFNGDRYEGVWGAILKNLPALRTLVNDNSFGEVPDDGFRAFKDTLETLVWDSVDFPFPKEALLELTCLKHLKIDSIGWILADQDSWRLSPMRNLPQTVETLDVYVSDYDDYDDSSFEYPEESPAGGRL